MRAGFFSRPLPIILDGKTLSFFTPTWIDGKKANRLYLQAETAHGTALLQIDGTADPVEVLRTSEKITAMTRAPDGTKLLLGTSRGLYMADGEAPFAIKGTLGSVQCFSMHQATLYACAWNYSPDRAAIARLSDDAQSFAKVFQFDDTKGPLDCPANTPVARICPEVWANYADQLGVRREPPPVNAPAEPQPGCAMAATSRSAHPSGQTLPAAALAVGLILWTKTRRRLIRQAARDEAAAKITFVAAVPNHPPVRARRIHAWTSPGADKRGGWPFDRAACVQ